MRTLSSPGAPFAPPESGAANGPCTFSSLLRILTHPFAFAMRRLCGAFDRRRQCRVGDARHGDEPSTDPCAQLLARSRDDRGCALLESNALEPLAISHRSVLGQQNELHPPAM